MNLLLLVLIAVVALIVLGVALKLAFVLLPVAAVIFAGYMIYTALLRSKGRRI